MQTGRTTIALLFTLLLGVLPAGTIHAAPHAVNYQGILNDSAGSTVPDQAYNMVFRIYDAATGGTLLYEESQTVTTVKGIYNALLGTGTASVGIFDPALFSADNRWLEVEVNAEILTPRQPVTSVAFSLQAEEAAHAAVADDATTLAGQPASNYDQSGHVTDTGNPHNVTAAQAGADPSGAAATVQGNLNTHAADASAHHTKTSSFTELTDTAAEAQIPSTIARDTELTWGNLSGIPAGFADGTDNDSGGDITGVTAGTGLIGGGINGDVTLGLQLPLSLSGSSANPLVRSENIGNGWAFYGISHGSNSAVYGYNSPTGFVGNLGASNAGVKGSASGSGYGVYGSHNGGNYGWIGSKYYGVFGYGAGIYSGVYGTNSSGNYGQIGAAIYGVYGSSDSGTGVMGVSQTGIAGRFSSSSYGLIVDSGKVGIGTASPTRLLDLASTSGLFMGLDFGENQNAGITFSEAGTARWIFPFFRGWQSNNMIVRDEVSNIDVMTFEAGTGNVGIGTSTPSAKLEVNGNLKVTGNISWPAKVGFYSLSTADFHPVSSSTTYTNGGSELYVLGPASGASFHAPLHLPQGAVITKVTFFWFDNSVIKSSHLRLERYNLTTNTVEYLTSSLYSTESPAIGSLATTSITNPQVDNSTYTYWLLYNADMSADVALRGAGIEYTYSGT